MPFLKNKFFSSSKNSAKDKQKGISMPFLKNKFSSSSKDSVMEKQTCVQDAIEDDCWEVIFKLVKEDDPNNLASLSLVCKKFFLITNSMKTSLKVSDSTARHLPRALVRFRHIESICIDINFHKDVESLVLQISRSRLEHLETLEISHSEGFPIKNLGELGRSTNGLKKLKCMSISLCDDDLILLPEMFPWLEELYLNCFGSYEMVTDRGVALLSSKLRNLKKVSLCNFNNITDQAITCLSSNCKDLTGLEIKYCKHVTEHGIGFVLLHSFKLTSLTTVLARKQSFPKQEPQFIVENSTSDSFGMTSLTIALSNEQSDDGDDEVRFTIEDTISDARNLEELQLWEVNLSDHLLCSIAKCTSLKKVDFYPELTSNFTMIGLLTLVSECSSLKSFSPRDIPLDDQCLIDLCKYLGGLTSINICNCSVTCASFLSLTQYCPFIETIVMDDTQVGFYEEIDLELALNIQVKNISMKSCDLLNDLSLFRFVLVCPYLESLDISGSENITGYGIARVLRSCPELRHLNISGTKVSNFMGLDEMPCKLKSFQAEGTMINDQVMLYVGEICPELEELNIGSCDQVTELGVKLLVEKCEKLKKINMQGCDIPSPYLLDWMIATRPSLKEIVPPSGFIPSEELRNSFLAKGCLLLNGD